MYQLYAPESSNYTESQLLGETVYLESDVEDTDRYSGYLLRYVWLSLPTEINEDEVKTKMFNAILLANGYIDQKTEQSNVKYVNYFKEFCTEAKENKKVI